MGMHLVPLPPALIQERQLEQSPHVRTVAGERDEERDIGGIVLGALPVGVKVNRPRVPTHIERVGSDVLPNPEPLRQRIPVDLEMVRAVHGLGDRHRSGGRRSGVTGGRRRRRRRRRRRGLGDFSENLPHAQSARI